jgi:uncharacterized membrane protein
MTSGGQIIRLVGLLIEMLGILAVALESRNGGAEARLPGGFSLSPRLIWAVVAVGFVIWLSGSILTYWPQPPKKNPHPPARDRENLGL